MLRFRNLGSGSSGNATLVEARSGSAVTRILVDCGLGIRILERRLAIAGLGTGDIDALFITHEHSDHVGCAHTLALRERIPVWMSHGTWSAQGGRDYDGLLNTAEHGAAFEVGPLQVHPFAVPHDAREPLQLTCTDGDRRLGVLTDLGHVPAEVLQHLSGCHALLLECNHDPDLLEASAYPFFLKQARGGRPRSPGERTGRPGAAGRATRRSEPRRGRPPEPQEQPAGSGAQCGGRRAEPNEKTKSWWPTRFTGPTG
jgi:phosphoribosyl 1,2-cyclic phosphodiesterase